VRGVDSFLNAFQLASIRAIRQGFLEVGVQDNEVLMFSELMDSKSIFLTPNADTVYFIAFVDLTAGPMASRHRRRASASSTTCGSAG
jgi:hypothetical protein